MSKQLKYIISGGGSGGHIFPAVAIANALKRRDPNCSILFVGATGKMEMEKVPQAGYEIIGLNIAGLQRGSIVKNLTLPFKLMSSLLKAFSIVINYKPDAVIGVGGYASGPLLFAASVLGKPTIIQEQNAVPGLTNRILSRFADAICTAYDELKEIYKGKNVVLTGNPVRSEITTGTISRADACHYFGLDPDKKIVLLIGGSLGAGTLNEAVKQNKEAIEASGVQLLWQCGKFYYEKYKDVAEHSSLIQCRMFIDRMDYAYAVADVVISRGGALSIAELQIVGKPCVLVPSPNVTDDQQTKNVMALQNKHAAIYVNDKEVKTQLFDTVFHLLSNEEKKAELSKNLSALAITNADERIVDEIYKCIKR
ncbi:MAG: undecaprenyldiphospho-muramoylpentapeptide beta-N-acetylglucosaminyltransferase [Chitinophagales bacterium]|nr:undecaprenyldiphospho-muramoylpentapeptide beta-N-acetylglucosaminyltransferase [Chitinophagales bacterium]